VGCAESRGVDGAWLSWFCSGGGGIGRAALGGDGDAKAGATPV
jgi:hypothetical protein